MILLPIRFQSVFINASDKIQSDLHAVMQRYDQILSRNAVFFFNDYTDHGTEHVNRILASGDNLIDDDTFKMLNASDLFVFTFAVIIHDIGLHLTPGGFEQLLNGVWDSRLVKGLDHTTWNEEWKKFFKSTEMFTAEQRLNIFGKSDFNILPPDFSNLSETDRKLIGEFIRRSHPRLAHEMALNGFPYLTNDINVFIDGIDKNLRELSGLVARSHGMKIRDTYANLQIKYKASWKNPFNVKIIYLMALLRIADYIQIESNRAPSFLLKIKTFDSPFSQNEWHLHNCIKFVDTQTDDKELLNIYALPENSQQFTKLTSLLKDIQNELDVSWAIIGETYGTNYKLRYRRLASNIFDVDAFSESVDYVPFPLTFHTDNSLLKLLISPLYKNDPGMGVRELLQNALDAIYQRSYLSKTHEKYAPRILIEILMNDPEITFSIQDNGVGMSLMTLTEFYFKAGRSYRNSIEWVKLFTQDDREEVLRTGRFGVGALATFLLGNEVIVETRALNEAEGFTFIMKAHEDIIQVNKRKNLPVGTKIIVKMRKEVKRSLIMAIDDDDFRRLKWFSYYIQGNDFVEYRINKLLMKAFTFPRKVHLTHSSKEPNEQWSYMEWEDLKIFFTYNFDKSVKLPVRENGAISCNGFRIINGYDIEPKLFYWALPELFIEDKQGRLPLSLDRNSVYNDSILFEQQLVEQIAIDLINKLENAEFKKIGDLKQPLPLFLNYQTEISLSEYIICFKNHYSFNLPFILKKLNSHTIYTITPKPGIKLFHKNIFREDVAYTINDSGEDLNASFSILNSNVLIRNLSENRDLYIDPFYRQSKEANKLIAIPDDLKMKIKKENIENSPKKKSDNNVDLLFLEENQVLNRLKKLTFVAFDELNIPWLEAIFNKYYHGDYRIPYSRINRRSTK